MKGEFKRTLKVTKNEQEMIYTFIIDIMEELFGLDPEKEPNDLSEIMYAISMQSPKAYLCNDKGTIEIEYQDD